MPAFSFLADPARRNVAVLATAQALFHCTQTMAIATTPLAALAMLGESHAILATVPIFLAHFGLMCTTLPAALLMGRIGRRPGFSLGATLGILAGLVSFSGVWTQSFPLMCLGGFLQGGAAAFAWHYRFAATDVADANFKAKAISLVMAGGIAAGVLGPQLAKWSVNLLPYTYAGVYLTAAVSSAIMLLLIQGIQIPTPAKTDTGAGGRPMSVIMRQPAFIAAVTASMIGYAIMTLVMSATPLAMKGCGFDFTDSATVIQVHVLAMFVPSFFTGSLVNRFGVKTIVVAGALIEILCALTNLAGISIWNFAIANLLVGLGWNFCYVGGTTLLTTVYRPEERAKVQGTHDFLVYATTALAAGTSGTLQAQAGWATLNMVAIPALLFMLAVIGWYAMQPAKTATSGAA